MLSVRRPAVILLAAVLGLGACAGGLGSRDYSRTQARGEQSVRMGVVESVREVSIEGTKTPIGAGAGAAVGGIAGNSIGGEGRSGIVGAVIGAVAGGLGGAAAEEGFTRKKGIEVTVKLDSGNLVAITQEIEENEAFKPGDRVRIVSGGGVSRVAH